MSKTSYTIFDFLKDCRGNWRNAIFIPCEPCKHPCGNERRGCLLTADCDGRPRAVCVTQFEAITGQKVEGPDCIGVLSRRAFESAFYAYLMDCFQGKIYEDMILEMVIAPIRMYAQLAVEAKRLLAAEKEKRDIQLHTLQQEIKSLQVIQ